MLAKQETHILDEAVLPTADAIDREGFRMSGPLVSVILAMHNGMDHIEACLDSVFAQDYSNFEIILVDNASTDGLSDYVEQHFPMVRQVRSQVNLGYGPGNNLGASAASADLLLFLNHDTIVTKQFLAELVRVMENCPEIGVAQSKIKMATDRDLIDSIGAYLTMTGMWFHPNHNQPDRVRDVKPIEVLGAAGACLMVRRELFEALEGFDPDFFIYFDDADLAWRARMLGSNVVMAPKSVIYHWGGATTQRLPSAFTVYHSFKNRLCSLLKLLCLRDLIIVLPIHLALCMGGALAYLLKLKPTNALAIIRALLWNLMNLGKTRTKRADILKQVRGDHRQMYEGLIRALPLGYFMRASVSYVSKW